MRQSERPASTEAPYDHLVVAGAGVSGLAYAWRRQREGRRVVVLDPADAEPPTPGPAVVAGEAPHLEALLAALPGAPRLEPLARGPLQRLSRGGLRPVPALALGRLCERPGAAADLLRERIGGARGPIAPRLRVLPGGVGALRARLAEALGSALRPGTLVARVRPAGGKDDEWAIAETEEGGLRAREVALATDAGAQATLLAAAAPQPADALRAVTYVRGVEARLTVASNRLPPIAGFIADADSSSRMRSAFFVPRSAPSSQEDVLVLARLEGEGLDTLPEPTLGRIAAAALDRAVGGSVASTLLDIRRVRWCRPASGHRGRMAALACDLQGRGVRLLGTAALGETLDRLAVPGIPVAGPLPEGTTIA